MPPCSPRPATQNAPKSQPASPPQPLLPYGVRRIVRTGRLVPAPYAKCIKYRRQRIFIRRQQNQSGAGGQSAHKTQDHPITRSPYRLRCSMLSSVWLPAVMIFTRHAPPPSPRQRRQTPEGWSRAADGTGRPEPALQALQSGLRAPRRHPEAWP
jgi:hypothetical protein